MCTTGKAERGKGIFPLIGIIVAKVGYLCMHIWNKLEHELIAME
jgi:hypothetical protein